MRGAGSSTLVIRAPSEHDRHDVDRYSSVL
jgi:hypothetical protein